MTSIRFKQFKNPKSKIFGTIFLLFGAIGMTESYIGFIVFLIGVLFFFINFEIEINKDFNNKTNVTLFDQKILSLDRKVLYPDYISLFGQSFGHSNDFSTVSALGSSSQYDFYVIRFFDENNRNEIIFKSKNKDEVLIKGSELSLLLDVELVNKLEA